MRFSVVVAAVVLTLALASCGPFSPAALTAYPTPSPSAAKGTPTATATATPTPTATPTQYPCPQATAELLAVEPVTSPTEALSQTVTVHIGNSDAVTITTQSGRFTAPRQGPVTVALLPDTTHFLEVAAHVRRVTDGHGCVYGGYTLGTTRDRNGAPLVIVQGRPGPPRPPGAVLGPENLAGAERLALLVPTARLTTDLIFRDDAELISVGYDEGPAVWSTASGQVVRHLGDAEALVVTASTDGAWIATAGPAENPSVIVWDAATGQGRTLGSPGSGLTALAFSPGGAWLASGGSDDTVRVWDVAAGREVATLHGDVPGRAQLFHSLFWAGEDTLIAAGSDAIYWWDVAAGQMVRRVPAPEGAPFMVDADLTGGGERVAAVAQDGRVYVWDRAAGEWAAWSAGPGAALGHVALSPNGRLLVAAGYEGDVYAWNTATGEPLPAAQMGGWSIAALRFSPSGRYLAAGGWDGPIALWGVPAGKSTMLPIVRQVSTPQP